jgi:hypothetical protein
MSTDCHGLQKSDVPHQDVNKTRSEGNEWNGLDPVISATLCPSIILVTARILNGVPNYKHHPTRDTLLVTTYFVRVLYGMYSTYYRSVSTYRYILWRTSAHGYVCIHRVQTVRPIIHHRGVFVGRVTTTLIVWGSLYPLRFPPCRTNFRQSSLSVDHLKIHRQIEGRIL